jgi:hypothetical protein
LADLIDQNEWDQLRSFVQGLRLSEESWLCRGAVRCHLLGELQDWDDFDVITNASEGELASAIAKSNLPITRTFHGGYSFKSLTGRKIDIWALARTSGRECASLAEALSAFEFNVDAIARSFRSNEINDPLNVRSEILSRKLRIQETAQIERNAYLPVKAAYLVLRHDFEPDESIRRIWMHDPQIGDLPTKAIPALRQEIVALRIRRDLRTVKAFVDRYPGLVKYVDLLVPE